MSDTVTKTIQRALDLVNPNELADLLRKIKFGHMVQPVKAVVTGLTAAAAIDITSAAVNSPTSSWASHVGSWKVRTIALVVIRRALLR